MANNMYLAEELDILRKTSHIDRVPVYIKQNINPQMPIRTYQEEALENFITYFNNDNLRAKPAHVLFHMATGSGKTLVMAALVLYLFKQGYRNFLFFVNSTNIIQKTKDNFFNSQSIKYLFNTDINIDGVKIKVNEVENFQQSDPYNINICFSTIQSLYLDLHNPKENSLTPDDFKDSKIVLIADEAHHLSVDTKRKLTKLESDELFSWEMAVQNILNVNNKNILLEFTATCDLENSAIRSKYINKLIYDYPLKNYRLDGYSKEVNTYASQDTLEHRIIKALLLSQYRFNLFQDIKKYIKPVVLFKSKTIDESKKLYSTLFRNLIENLSEKDLIDLKNNDQSVPLQKAFTYFEKNKSLDALIQEIQEGFSEDKCISVNSKEEKESYQIKINTLEDSSNKIRAIFAVDQLNEGWDVLNLFDIVRMYDTRAGSSGTGLRKQTVQEAQLIGRGARYCPVSFDIVDQNKDLFKRKLDHDLNNEFRICETLYYHCLHDVRYITDLKRALRESGIMDSEDKVTRKYIVKEDFKNTNFYKSGVLFANKRNELAVNTVRNLLPSIKNKIYCYDFSRGEQSVTNLFDESATKTVDYMQDTNMILSVKDIAKFNFNIVHKALRQYRFFNFDNLKLIFTSLQDIKTFILDPNYLGNIRINIKYSDTDKCKYIYLACRNMFGEIANKLSTVEYIGEGSKEFYSIPVRKIVKDKDVSSTHTFEDFKRKPYDNGQGYSQINEVADASLKVDVGIKDWFVYTDHFGTSEEKELIVLIDKYIDKLRKKFDQVYCIRNEEVLKLYSFNGGEGYQPDFILVLINSENQVTQYQQIFIEPKGTQLLATDLWKENFLKEIHQNAEINLSEKDILSVGNEKYNLYGFPFFNKDTKLKEFTDVFESFLK